MDLITVREVRLPRSREELVFADGDRALGGGTWLYSEPQAGIEALVDLTTMGWQHWPSPASRLHDVTVRRARRGRGDVDGNDRAARCGAVDLTLPDRATASSF